MLDSIQGCDLALFFADFSQIENFSEMEPPLATNKIPAKVEIESKTNDIPLKKPKLEADVKPKFEADFKTKIEPAEEFNRSMEIIKGGLISESFSFGVKSTKILDSAQGCDLVPIFGRFEQK